MSPVFEHGSLRLYLLKLLDEQPRHGYDLMQQLEQRLDGHYSPSAGTIYPRLARLQREGLVEPDTVAGRQKTYRITDAGRAELSRRQGELAEVEEQAQRSARALADEIRADVEASVRDLRAELKQAVRDVRRPGAPRLAPKIRVELDRFTAELTAVAAALTDADAPALRVALADAMTAVRRAVAGGH